jgi:hypothetical protein
MGNSKQLIPIERIENKINLIRGQTVMTGRGFASLYSIEIKAPKQAVKRKLKRFPDDFMFALSHREFAD